MNRAVRLAIYGAGGCGRALAHSVCAQAAKLDEISEVVFTDDAPPASAFLPIVPFVDLQPGDRFVLGIAGGALRERLEQKCLAAGLVPFDSFAPDFDQGMGNHFGPGCVFMARTMVTTNVRIGRQFQCNIYSYVEHDCQIGDYVTFAPRVSCNGNIVIEDHAYIGSGAVIRQGQPDRPLTIGARAVIGMGAVVTKDVPPGAVMIGNPARMR